MVSNRFFRGLAAALVLSVSAIGCDDDDEIAAPESQNIVETAIAAGSFSTLVTAVEAAGLAETLANDGPFTVFAPTDEAFDALPAGTLDALLQDTDALREILLYHVVAGEVRAQQVVTLSSAPTLQGSDVEIDATNAGVKVNDANVTQTDIVASNGVIHVIDSVLLPPQ